MIYTLPLKECIAVRCNHRPAIELPVRDAPGEGRFTCHWFPPTEHFAATIKDRYGGDFRSGR